MKTNAPKIYLKNKDILKEIHKSKNTYSCYEPGCEDYDFIVDTLDDLGNITEEQIKQAKQNRLDRLYGNDARKKLDLETNPILKSDLVFRVMIDDHIPNLKNKKGKVALNFPAFQHFKIYEMVDGVEEEFIRCVGKSHWRDGVHNGQFSLTHGITTPKLAKMYMELCKKYGNRWNWAAYTYNDEMRAQAVMQLVQVGLKFNEARSDIPFAYYTTVVMHACTRVQNIEKRGQNIRDDILEQNNVMPSLARQMKDFDD